VRLRLILLFSLLAIPDGLPAQLEPPSTGGLAALDQALRPLARYQRVLMIAAHPDDEDTELLTLLVRGIGAEAAYLSLTRGEGGQNLIGSELGEALGLVRTGELLAARRLDGARQYFSRAYDFGFSKHLDDTWAHWPRDSVLKDVVRVVRRFRPQVVVSIFSGTSRDGHGQHQAAGWAAHEAFRIAGDSTAFPELFREHALEPWTPLKLYRSTRFDSAATTLLLDGGELDPATGLSYHQIAMRGRSLHRSQDMGQLQRLGPSRVRLSLVEDRSGAGGNGLFSGLDTTLAGVPAMAGLRPEPRRAVAERLMRYAARVDSARVLLAPALRPALQALLGRAAQDLDDARRQAVDGLPGGRGRRLITNPVLQGDPFEGEMRRLDAARLVAQDVVLDGVSEDERVIPGQRVGVTLSLWNPGTAPANLALCVGSLRFGWSVRTDSVRTAEIPRSPRRGACAWGWPARSPAAGSPPHACWRRCGTRRTTRPHTSSVRLVPATSTPGIPTSAGPGASPSARPPGGSRPSWAVVIRRRGIRAPSPSVAPTRRPASFGGRWSWSPGWMCGWSPPRMCGRWGAEGRGPTG
jgi:LmbE family N-acetylglucosaminyl deacetylase